MAVQRYDLFRRFRHALAHLSENRFRFSAGKMSRFDKRTHIALMAVSAVLLAAAPQASAASDDEMLAKARKLVFAANPETCDPSINANIEDVAYPLSWSEPDYDGVPQQRSATLFEINCFMGAYNLVVGYVYATSTFDSDMKLVAFSRPAYDVDYVPGDDTYTKLAHDPVANGFVAELTLINPVFNPDAMTITTSEQWRGLGDAWSAGVWRFDRGQFVLSHYAVDPIYEFNLEDPPEELGDVFFVLYDAGDDRPDQ